MGALIAIVAGALCIVLALPSLKAWMRMRRTEPTRVADISPSMGEVELVGHVRPIGKPFKTPVSERDAVVSRFRIDVRKTAGPETGGGYFPVIREEQRQPFLLDDGSGMIVVDPRGAAVNLEQETWTVERKQDPPGVIRQFLQRSEYQERAARDMHYPAKRKFAEATIVPDGKVYVYGPVQDAPFEGAGEAQPGPWVGSRELLTEQDKPVKRMSYGLAGESAVFTLSNTGEDEAQKTASTQAKLWIGMGLLLVAVGVVMAVT